jgi:hypothetical protein
MNVIDLRTPRAPVRPKPDRVIEDVSLDDYDDKFLQCRDIRHPWEIQGYWQEGAFNKRRLICPRCETVAIDTWRANGAREARRYEYAQGYQKKGSGGVDPSEVRKEQLRRAQVFGSQEEMFASLYARRKNKQ